MLSKQVSPHKTFLSEIEVATRKSAIATKGLSLFHSFTQQVNPVASHAYQGSSKCFFFPFNFTTTLLLTSLPFLGVRLQGISEPTKQKSSAASMGAITMVAHLLLEDLLSENQVSPVFLCLCMHAFLSQSIH